MKTIRLLLPCVVFFLWVAPETAAQIGKRIPVKLGYVYPAGGQRGTTFEIWVVGRLNVRTFEPIFSGTGVTGRVIDTQYAFRNLDQRDRWMIRNRVGDAADKHVSDSPEGKLMAELIKRLPKVNKPPDPPEEIEAIPFAWPRHARIRKLSESDVFLPLDETLEIIYYFYGPPMWRRPPDPLMDVAIIEVTVAPEAEPGDRELRLLTPSGLTNPLYFQIGVHPEVVEREPNSMDTHGIANYMREFPQPVYDTPVVINGQILHSDVDQFKFRAQKGQQLVLQAQARQLMPFLADAVPGWFEAVITVYDESGKELQYADCDGFRADPKMVFTVPADGVYTAEIRDSLFRGREDFVYRLSIVPGPVVESVFPLGLKEGTSTSLKLTGKSLSAGEVNVNAAPGPDRFRELTRLGNQWLAIPIRYEVDTLPEITEAGNNTVPISAQAVTVPVVVNGRISQPGEHDFYRFDGKEGERVSIEVVARRLDSKLDSRIALFDASGKQIVENDDGPTIYPDNNYLSDIVGTQTHNADSKLLELKLPAGGPFTLRIGDAGRKGGPDYGYRLRISRPRPDFDVFTTPSGVTLPGKGPEPIWFYVSRKECFDAPIEIRLAGETHGFHIDGGLIQGGEDGVIATLLTPADPRNKAIPLRFEAVSTWNGQTVRRPVYSVEDMEQAFLYHHWVPATDLWVLMTSHRPPTGFRPVGVENSPIVLKQGQSVDVEFVSEASWIPSELIFSLREPPPGISVSQKSRDDKKLVLTFKAAADALLKIAEKEFAVKNPTMPTVDSDDKDGEKKETSKPVIEPKPRHCGNLIVTVDAMTAPKDPNAKKTRYQTGFLPAIPFRLEP